MKILAIVHVLENQWSKERKVFCAEYKIPTNCNDSRGELGIFEKSRSW